MKKRISTIAVTTLIIMNVCMFLISCSSSDIKEQNNAEEFDNVDSEEVTSEGEYLIYCINNDETGLDSWKYTLNNTAMSSEDKAKQLIEAFSIAPKKEGCTSARAKEIAEITCTVRANVVKINCHKNYDNLDSLSQLYFKAALVLTLTQIDGLDYVYITVNNQPLTDSLGNAVGYLSENSFAMYEENLKMESSKLYTTIYYANESGDALIAESGYYIYDHEEIPALFVLELMRTGAEKRGNYVIPEETVVENAFVKDGICYVDFNEKINDNMYMGINPQVVLYSIVNTLCELNGVTGVQITINGGTEQLLQNEIDLNQIYRTNLDLVEK